MVGTLSSLLGLALALALRPVGAKPLQHAISKELVGRDCALPAKWTVSNFTMFTPDAAAGAGNGTGAPSVINYNFGDNDTAIHTPCHYNSPSKPAKVNRANKRYACDNTMVTFIWQDGQLTLIEAQSCSEKYVASFALLSLLTRPRPSSLIREQPQACDRGLLAWHHPRSELQG